MKTSRYKYRHPLNMIRKSIEKSDKISMEKCQKALCDVLTMAQTRQEKSLVKELYVRLCVLASEEPHIMPYMTALDKVLKPQA